MLKNFQLEFLDFELLLFCGFLCPVTYVMFCFDDSLDINSIVFLHVFLLFVRFIDMW